MMPFHLFRLAAGALLLCAAGQAAAQISALRYIDKQGIEVIVNRDAPRPAELPGAQPAAVPAAKAVRDPKLQIAAAEQDRRDRDRVGILQQELDSEARKYAALMQRSQPGPGAEKLSAADAQRLTEELYDRQKNIQSLNAELRRARSAQ
ncbi:hypothetical protein [Massilia sp. S19_KUP03_FR1]|uniref:hypothetical protein n=1 Tax=Massilia sp. S19_KUP03_FR1 TaxID=3025503 RepID=UPI002FCD8843